MGSVGKTKVKVGEGNSKTRTLVLLSLLLLGRKQHVKKAFIVMEYPGDP